MIVKPDNWHAAWSKPSVEFLKPLMKSIDYELSELDHVACFDIWPPHSEENRRFISLGVTRPGKQANGNPWPKLYAFGFFEKFARRWPDNFVEGYAEYMVEQFQIFMDEGKMPDGKYFDTIVMNPERQPQAFPDVKTDIWGEPIEEDPLS